MKIKNLTFLPFLISPCIIAASCNNDFDIKVNKELKYGLNTNESILNKFTIEQLKILNKFRPLFIAKSNELNSSDIAFQDNDILVKTKNKQLSLSKYLNYKPTAKLGLHLINDQEHGWKYIMVDKNKSTIDNYDLLFERYDYIFDQDLNIDFPDINSIIKRISTSTINDQLNITIPNFITPNWIRAKAWAKNKEQISYWEDLILFELKRFDFGSLKPIQKVKISVNNFIESNVGRYHKNAPVITIDFLDSDGKSLLSKNLRNKKFIIGQLNQDYLIPYNEDNVKNYNSLFRDYNSVSDFKHTLDIDDDEVLFNEYVNVFYDDITILKYINPLSLENNQYELYVNPTYLYNKVSARSFLWFLKNDEKYFEIVVPEHRKNVDLKYEIVDKKINDEYLNDSLSLIELKIKVTKLDGSIKFYKWYSIDINSHYHTFAGYKTNLDTDWNSNNIYGYGWDEKLGEGKINRITRVIDPNEFYEKMLLKLLSLQVYKLKDNLTLFNNRVMTKYEAHNVDNNTILIEQLKTKFGIDVFKYLIGNSNNKNDLIDDIDVKYLGLSNEPGCVLLKVDFLDKNKNSMLNDINRNKIIKWYGFNGTDFTKINKQISKYNIVNANIDYLLKNSQVNLKDQNNIIDYFEWKE
ncbi:hypothetical protein KQ873_01575 [Mycoplasma zalophidermidis]|uniref:MAG3240 family lipoprotein n=1 Tax=Mycoplasma zalophidermidis TaxID=398174 RepID=UPI001C10DCEA|nr:hypothetical protein [Mycoplasma zalophidermidis]MBU4689728.1 hypothetical protein [Mycoplasma zalophidermidis]